MTYAEEYRRRYPERCYPTFLGQCGCMHWSNAHNPETGECTECDCLAFKGE